MEHDDGTTVVKNELIRLGSTAVRAKMFARVAGILLVAGAARPARASLTASYEGTMTLLNTPGATVVSAALAQQRGSVTGSVTLVLPDPAATGAYLLQGHTQGRRFVLRGTNASGARLRWRGRLTRDRGVRGPVRIRMHGARMAGMLALSRKGTAGSCGSSYFTDTVMPQVALPVCGRCHVAGGLAQAARFRVTKRSAAATEQSALTEVDTADPAASRIVLKPLGQLGHGGGAQIVAGGPEEQALRHWVDLVTVPECTGTIPPGGGGGGGTGADLYTANCTSCHGPDARGLQGIPDVHCNRGIHDVIRAGRQGGPAGDMPAFPDLSDADIALIQAYLTGLCPLDQASGADLYVGLCARCHGTTAGGVKDADVHGPNIRCAGRGGFFEKVMRGAGQKMPAFPELSSAAIDRIVTYVHGFCVDGIGDAAVAP